MNHKLFKVATGLLWLALPFVAFEYWSVWEQLPTNMATHFNAAGQANGWMTRAVAAEFGIGVVAVLLVVLTPILWAMSRTTSDKFTWAFWVFSLVVLSVAWIGNRQVIAYNLQGKPVQPTTVMIFVLAAVVLVTVAYFSTHRGESLPASELIAEETHASRGWSALILLAVVGPFLAIAQVPSAAARIGLGVGLIVLLGAVGMAWSGFQYRFLRHGVEIRTLGYRLRSIPRQTIQSYAIEPWMFLRGYGIRGIGHTRAYVWCNKVVHIKTANGDVYLGHNDPERIVRDLDMVTAVNRAGHQG